MEIICGIKTISNLSGNSNEMIKIYEKVCNYVILVFNHMYYLQVNVIKYFYEGEYISYKKIY